MIKELACPKCKISEELFNLAKRKDATLMIYNEGKPRVRASDGLHVFPLICFKCKTMTEWASDPENQSGKAIDGVEYFETKKISKEDKSQALEYANEQNQEIVINKLKTLK